MMKYSAIVILTILVALVAICVGDDPMDQKYIAHTEECIKESKVSVALIANLKDGDFPEDKDFKCFLKCLYVKVGVMNEKGEFNVEELKKTLEKDQDEKLVDKCKILKGTDICDTAFVVAKCMETG